MAEIIQAVATARRLAGAHPQATLPCPGCAASVKAQNLERHLAKLHAGALQAAGGETQRVTLGGADRWIVRPAIGLVVVWAVVVTGVFASGVALTNPLMAGIGAALLVVFTVLLLALLGVFRARLVLEHDHVQLRCGLGLVSRSLQLPTELEVGSLIERKDSSLTNLSSNAVAEDRRVGRYLRLVNGGRAITVGAAKAAGLGQHWAAGGWRAGSKRRGWDISVDRETMIALEYYLAGRGLLQPKV
ncbi:hypothetical protein DB30_00257 [Enhygromyxa salina]|uniref:Uncharacterized protein n=1 Tax=Enhygromyxa salina TaxID=215803 RepID=A0A0C2DFX4_9BACT|nr:hypothetical protein [Enhygromyxa salina]KIG18572.1 hypothetical protein DB30_00257 [Enhygromyxa salina]